ncbi:hypothetical protein J0J30_23150, partial [Vibrio vulnificus]|nr:hypothetical protein [Vibrio vulnificus]
MSKGAFSVAKRGGAGSCYSGGGQNPSYYDQKPYCSTCGKQHFERCRTLIGGCYYCGDMGHYLRDCPKRSEGSKSESTVQRPRTSEVSYGRGRGRG